MTRQERKARDYCRSIGASPDQPVWGIRPSPLGKINLWTMPRWRWYVGAKVQPHQSSEATA